jgi:KipI family sensor histidine kinase inhibitor
MPKAELMAATTVTLPVYYHPDCGCDLLALAEQLNMPWQRIAELHQAQSYQVFALGFSPGFAFMGEVPLALQVPRHAQPRRHVAAGSVAIAEKQSAIYPNASPGGWHILGRCPQTLFNPRATPPNLLTVGQTVKFKAISREEFLHLGGKLDE